MRYRTKLGIFGTAVAVGFLALGYQGKEHVAVYQGHHPEYGETRLEISQSANLGSLAVETRDLQFTLLDLNNDRKYDMATIRRGEGFSRGRLERDISPAEDQEIERLERIARETVAAARRGELRRTNRDN